MWVVSGRAYTQATRFNIQYTLPASITICGKADSVVMDIRNISASGINNISLSLKLPTGCNYQASSFKGTGITESNITNLNAPVFRLPNFTLAGYVRFSFKLSANCDLQSFISKGNPALIRADFTYTGGSESHASSSLNVSVPNLLISTMTNQVKNAYLADKFVRETTVKNTGKGGVARVVFFRTIGSGLKVTSNRSRDTYKADSVISVLDSIDFKKVGNKDAYLDGGEEISIADTVTVKGCTGLLSYYVVKFSCGPTICNTSVKNAIVNLDAFTPGLKGIPGSTIDWCFDASKPAKNTLILVNGSNKPVSNVTLNIFQSYNGGFYNSLISAVDTGSLVIRAGKNGKILKPVYTVLEYNFGGSYFACLGTSPLGGFSLLFPNMKVGDSIYLSWNARSCVPNVCNAWTLAHRWRYSATYYDPCFNPYSMTENWGSVGSSQSMTATPWVPSDLVGGIAEKLNFTFASSYFYPLSTRARFSVKLSLPAGIMHSLKPDDIKFTDINGTDWKPYVVKVSGSTVTAHFTSPVISLTKAELNITINADCKAYNPSGNKTYTVAVTNMMDSVCMAGNEFQLYCYTGTVKVHCSKACPNGGMLFKTFSVKRKTVGLPDNNNDGNADGSGSLNFSKIKLNRSMLYDTLTTYHSGMVLTSGTTNLFFNGRLKTTVTYGNYLTPMATATVSIFRNGKLRYSCNKLPVTSSVYSTYYRSVDVDMTLNAAKTASCGKISDYFFLNGDSVVVAVNYVYTTSVGSNSLDAIFDNTEFWVSTTSNPSPSQKLQCDTFSGRHILLGNYFTNWYTENYQTSSCSPVTIYNSYYFSAGSCCDNYAGGNVFPYEFRNFNYPEKMSVVLPVGYSFSSAYIYYYRSNGTNKYTTHTATNLKPVKTNTDTLVFLMDTLFNATKGVFKRSDEGYQGTLYVNLIPNCKASLNTLEPVFYNTEFRWPNAGVTTPMTNYPDYLSFTHPSLNMAAINTLSVSKKDTFTWDIILSNSKPGSTVDNVWFANSQTNKASIFGVKDLSTGTMLSSKNGIFKAGTVSNSAARTFRVYARSKNCVTDSFRLAVGWNCTSYPDSLEAYSCKNLLNYINLILSPTPPLLVSTLFEDTARTDVCANRTFKALVANVDEDNIYNVRLRATIPQGTSFVDTALYYSFPYGSKKARLPRPVLISGTTWEWALSDSLSALRNGLERVSDTTKSRLLVEFQLETNCQITAGAFVSIMPDGKIGCGEPVRRIGFTGQPIRIKGVDNPYYTMLTLSPDSINLCTPSTAFRGKAIFLGPTRVLANDSLMLSLPPGYIPDTASFKATNLVGKGKVNIVNGEVRWTWLLPKGLNPGDSAQFDFRLNVSGNAATCGGQPFLLQTITKKKAYCVKSKDSCDINVATGSFYKSFKTDRAEPVIRLIRSTSVNAGDSGEVLDLSFSVTNNKKSIDTAFSTSFLLVVDRNGNNKLDKTESVITRFTKQKGWNQKQTVAFTYKGFIRGTDVCKLLIVSDSTNCQCIRSYMPLLNIRNQNAGRDTAVCTNYSVRLGQDSVRGYKYEWSPASYLNSYKISSPVYKKSNLTANNLTLNYMIKTTRPGGCFSMDTVVLVAKPFITLPKLKDTVSMCAGGSVQIGDTAKGGKGTLSFNWMPNNSLSAFNRMIVKATPKSTTKYIFTVTDQNACSIKDSTVVNVSRLPSVKIGYSGKCEKRSVQFTDLSDYYGQSKGSVIWRINFNNVYQVDPTFAFDTIGYYFVRLVATNNIGCTDSNYAYVRINGLPQVLNSKTSGCLGDSVSLNDQSKVARMGVKSVKWVFSTDSANGKAVKKYFATPGVHRFNQFVVSDSGCVNSASDSVYIQGLPKAGISISGSCLVDSARFKNQTVITGSDSIKTYTWKIGAWTYTIPDPVVKFDTAGYYRVSLVVASKQGCRDTQVVYKRINPMPVVTFTIGNFCPYDSIRATNTGGIGRGSVKAWTWSIDNLYSSNTRNLLRGPMNEGIYTVRLKAVSDSACSDSSEQIMKVFAPVKPRASFVNGCTGDSMRISEVSLTGNTRVMTRQFTLGSQIYTDSSFRIKTGGQGSFPFSLRVVSAEGCAFKRDSFYLVSDKPVASFADNSPCQDNRVDLADKSVAGTGARMVSRTWLINGGGLRTDSAFRMTFPGSGNQLIFLRVRNNLGCVDSTIRTIVTGPANYAALSGNDACPGDPVNLTFTGNTGSNVIRFYDVRWGDGTKASTLPAQHIYLNPGTYRIDLTITTYPGCDYDTFTSVRIHNVPQAGFDFYPKYPDIKYPNIQINDQSKGAVSWKYYANGTWFSDLQNPKYSFPDSGAYYVLQKVQNQHGCADSTEKRVYVNFILLTHIPNAFSPGNDDINPLFAPQGLGIKDYKLTIFNRWGEKIFDPGWGRHPWDGTYKEEFVPIGSYPYYLEVIDYGNIHHNYNGLIEVVR